MHKKLLILLFVSLLIACNSAVDHGKRVITTSIPPFKFFTSAIAGDDFEVNVIVPPGASPATFEPTPSVIRGLNSSELLILDGYLGYELAWADQLAGVNPGIKRLILADSQDLIYGAVHSHGDDHGEEDDYTGVDPHFWVSPVAARRIAADILAFLKTSYPQEATVFETNYTLLIREIDRADIYLDSLFAENRGRSFMIFHPSLTYLARDYNLEQVAVETDGKEPTPAGLVDFIDHAKRENIGVIFVQREFDKKNAETIASEIDAEVVEIDPLSENWPQSVRSIGDALSRGFKKK